MTNPATQCARILHHMKQGKRITFAQAFSMFGVMHLPRRILDLKQSGVKISDRFIETPSGKRVKEYWLG